VIDLERSDFDASLVVHHALADILGQDHDALRRGTVVVQPDADVVFVRKLKMRHHLSGASWAPDGKGMIAARGNQPSRHPEIRETDHMIGVQVGEKDAADVLPAHLELG
jgi:hypothetical protein